MGTKTMKMSRKRVGRIRSLIDYIIENRHELRYYSLDRFARLNGVTYDTVKKDLKALAYATIPSLPAGFDKRYIPRSHRRDVDALWELMGKRGGRKAEFTGGEIDYQKAREASTIFLLKSPRIDVERFRIIGPQNPRIEKLQEMFVKQMEDLADLINEKVVHPARGFLDAWRFAGIKVHKEIPELLEKLEGAPPSMREEIAENIWRMNLYKAMAAVNYQRFVSRYLWDIQRVWKVGQIRMPREDEDYKEYSKRLKGQFLPLFIKHFMRVRGIGVEEGKASNAFWKRLLSDVKTLRRWYWPGMRKNLPRKLKLEIKRFASLIMTDPELSELYKIEEDLLRKEGRGEFGRYAFLHHMIENANDIGNADYWYSEAKKIEKKIEKKIGRV